MYNLFKSFLLLSILLFPLRSNAQSQTIELLPSSNSFLSNYKAPNALLNRFVKAEPSLSSGTKTILHYPLPPGSPPRDPLDKAEQFFIFFWPLQSIVGIIPTIGLCYSLYNRLPARFVWGVIGIVTHGLSTLTSLMMFAVIGGHTFNLKDPLRTVRFWLPQLFFLSWGVFGLIQSIRAVGLPHPNDQEWAEPISQLTPWIMPTSTGGVSGGLAFQGTF